jgi:sulfite reductase (NADPH) hemoprotein beta-component
MADVIGFFTPEHVENIAKAVLTIHRDFGDRTNRKHARLKYILEDRGPQWFKEELERRTGVKFAPARPFQFTKQGDLYGWHKQFDGKNFLGLFVEAGRIKDVPGYQLKTALRKIAEKYRPELRLSPSQNIILAGVPDSDVAGISQLLADHGVAVENQATVMRRASMACPAMPTCGLALAESERSLPDVINRIDGLMTEIGLGGEEIIIRMTGCPNGCARPFMAEIGFVGRGPGKYQVYAGGNESSTRLARLFKENVKTDDIVNEFRPVLTRYVQERTKGERFGDWCARVLWPETAAPVATVA